MRPKGIVISLVFLLIPIAVIVAQGVGISEAGFLTSLPPDAPLMISPADQVESLPDSITVIWHSRIHTSDYTLQVSSMVDFSDLFLSEIGTDTLFEITGLAQNTTYYWRVCGNNVAGEGDYSATRSFTTAATTDLGNQAARLPERYALLPAYPNPFNPRTTITYHLPEQASISLIIYNSTGQFVTGLASGHRQAGEYRVSWDGRDHRGISVPSGLYLCRFKTGSRIFTQKLLLMR